MLDNVRRTRCKRHKVKMSAREKKEKGVYDLSKGTHKYVYRTKKLYLIVMLMERLSLMTIMSMNMRNQLMQKIGIVKFMSKTIFNG